MASKERLHYFGCMNLVYERASTLLEAQVGLELVALDVDRGTCLGFNPVAATVWRHLTGSKSFDELRTLLLDEYEVPVDQCSSDLRALLDSMVDIGIIRLTNRES